ncbi:MAG: NRDE family protein [Gammaproteobacteria bacterium]|nr:NRDE family protein [Gammaproteobacteria bacterium]MDH3465368.1 NRDE family protein [Gammaproteobacteria bacterium]
MCFLLFALRADARYPLIVAANRDEFHHRATAPAAFWPDSDNMLLAGRDLIAGGTWLGIHRNGRIAALTNLPGDNNPARPSRGSLVSEFLQNSVSGLDYCEHLRSTADRYNGFNLVFGDTDALYYVSNRVRIGEPLLQSGIHGLSNDALNTPWPKVVDGKARLQVMLDSSAELRTQQLFDLVATRGPTHSESTDPAHHGAAIRASAFIIGEQYGTRSSTVLMVDAQRTVRFEERSFDRHGHCTNTERYRFILTE